MHSRACVRVGMDISEWFPVNVRLRKCCVMNLWLFNVYIGLECINKCLMYKILELLSVNCGRFQKKTAIILQVIHQKWLIRRRSCVNW